METTAPPRVLYLNQWTHFNSAPFLFRKGSWDGMNIQWKYAYIEVAVCMCSVLFLFPAVHVHKKFLSRKGVKNTSGRKLWRQWMHTYDIEDLNLWLHQRRRTLSRVVAATFKLRMMMKSNFHWQLWIVLSLLLYSSNVYLHCCVCSTQKGGYSQWHLMNYTTFCTIKSRVVLGIFYQVTLP